MCSVFLVAIHIIFVWLPVSSLFFDWCHWKCPISWWQGLCKDYRAGTLCLVSQQYCSNGWCKNLEYISTKCLCKSSRTLTELPKYACPECGEDRWSVGWAWSAGASLLRNVWGAQSPQHLWCLTPPTSCKDGIRAFLALGIRTSGTNGATCSWETARVVLYCGLSADEKPHLCPQLQSEHSPYNLVHRKVLYYVDMNIVIAHSECTEIMLTITWNIPGDLNTFAFYHVPLLMLWERTKGQISVIVCLFSEVTPCFLRWGD